MSKFTFFVFCTLAICGNIYADSESSSESGSGSNEELDALRDKCLKKFKVKEEDVDDAMMSGDVSKVKPCYWGCYFMKMGLLNKKGQYDLKNFKTTMKKILKDDDEEFARLEKIAKKCEAAVKDKAVKDGEAGCERGALLAACFVKNE